MFRDPNADSQTQPLTTARILFASLLLTLGALSSLSLSACGKKGPLYLPETPQETQPKTTNEPASSGVSSTRQPSQQPAEPKQETP
ncbi:MAG: LPS translocon maturation chaperone LptM [Hydrogenovibrio sp.]